MDVDGTDADASFGENHARALLYRAMLVVPNTGTVALLFCERQAASHLRGAFEQTLFKQVSRILGVSVRLSVHVDVAAWDAFLARGDAAEVTEVWRSHRPEDITADSGRAGSLKVTLTGNAAIRRGRALKNDLRQRLSGEHGAGAINVTLPEVEVTDEGFEHEELRIQIEDGHDRRTVVVEDAELPQWVYPLDGFAERGLLFGTWARHAQSILSGYGITLQEGGTQAASGRRASCRRSRKNEQPTWGS